MLTMISHGTIKVKGYKTVKFAPPGEKFLYIVLESDGDLPISVLSTIRQSEEGLRELSQASIFRSFNPTNSSQRFGDGKGFADENEALAYLQEQHSGVLPDVSGWLGRDPR